MRSSHARLGLALGVCLASLPAQNLVVYDAAAPSFFEGVALSPLYPAAGVLLNAYPPAMPLPPVAAMAGAVSLDGTNGITWYTGGAVLAAVPHNAYAPPGPVPAGPFPIPPALAMGPVTGMAVDPIAGVLWVTDGALVAGLSNGLVAPPAAVLVPPFALPIPALVAPPVTGLEWDGLTGTLWACDAGGNVYNFAAAPGGPPLAGPLPPAVPLPGPVLGITIDKTGNGMIYVVAAGVVEEIGTGVMFPSFGGGADVGMTFHPAPQPAPVAVCPCPNYTHGQVLLGPNATGNPAFGVDIVGLPPGNPVIYAFDFGFNPAFPVINGNGCPLGLTIGSPTLFSVFGLANAAGRASFPISLVGIGPGTPLYMQYASTCPADPFGWILTPLYQVIVAAP